MFISHKEYLFPSLLPSSTFRPRPAGCTSKCIHESSAIRLEPFGRTNLTPSQSTFCRQKKKAAESACPQAGGSGGQPGSRPSSQRPAPPHPSFRTPRARSPLPVLPLTRGCPRCASTLHQVQVGADPEQLQTAGRAPGRTLRTELSAQIERGTCAAAASGPPFPGFSKGRCRLFELHSP